MIKREILSPGFFTSFAKQTNKQTNKKLSLITYSLSLISCTTVLERPFLPFREGLFI